jgi:hypothetical protein
MGEWRREGVMDAAVVWAAVVVKRCVNDKKSQLLPSQSCLKKKNVPVPTSHHSVPTKPKYYCDAHEGQALDA